MSRTYKDRHTRRRIVKNSMYKKFLNIYGDDFHCKRKNRSLNRLLRKRLKREEEQYAKIYE